jgi:RHS repeat-associated protein
MSRAPGRADGCPSGFTYGVEIVDQATERNVSNVSTVSYMRGTDLSGTLEGAGGIGGLLARSHGYSGGNWSTHSFYHADGNGNITYMLNSSQSKVAEYRYDPFGNTISQSGTLAEANVYRFSSKEIHVNSGMYYYGYRWYDPFLQRWVNRDPLGEPGFEVMRGRQGNPLGDGPNLYMFVGNQPINKRDPFGLNAYETYTCRVTCMGSGRTATFRFVTGPGLKQEGCCRAAGYVFCAACDNFNNRGGQTAGWIAAALAYSNCLLFLQEREPWGRGPIPDGPW